MSSLKNLQLSLKKQQVRLDRVALQLPRQKVQKCQNGSNNDNIIKYLINKNRVLLLVLIFIYCFESLNGNIL